ncbi:MAG: hypothetical protein LBR22_10480 [Desulfovibrio sp.]|nr:hypothetical protein [Desulfovibrio sp.]
MGLNMLYEQLADGAWRVEGLWPVPASAQTATDVTKLSSLFASSRLSLVPQGMEDTVEALHAGGMLGDRHVVCGGFSFQVYPALLGIPLDCAFGGNGRYSTILPLTDMTLLPVDAGSSASLIKIGVKSGAGFSQERIRQDEVGADGCWDAIRVAFLSEMPVRAVLLTNKRKAYPIYVPDPIRQLVDWLRHADKLEGEMQYQIGERCLYLYSILLSHKYSIDRLMLNLFKYPRNWVYEMIFGLRIFSNTYACRIEDLIFKKQDIWTAA